MTTPPTPAGERLTETIERTLRAGRLSRRFLVGVIVALAAISLATVTMLALALGRLDNLATSVQHEQAQRTAQNAQGARFAGRLLIALDEQFRRDLAALLDAIRHGGPLKFAPPHFPTAPGARPTHRATSSAPASPTPSARSPTPSPAPHPTPTPRPTPHPTSPPPPTPRPHPTVCVTVNRHPVCLTPHLPIVQGAATVTERPARTIPDYLSMPEWPADAAHAATLPAVGASGPLLYPHATYRPIASHGGAMDAQDGLILHITSVHADPYGFFSNVNNGASSTWWIDKDGRVEQYYDARARCWAQMAGNGLYQAVETDGVPPEPLSDAQIEALAHLYVWGHRHLNWPLDLANAPGQRGFGWHGMGGAAWGGHYSCPDNARVKQRAAVLARAGVLLGSHPHPHPHPTPPTPPKPHPTPTPVNCAPPRYLGLLVPGSHGHPVHEWQAQMIKRGWNLGPSGADGAFGPKTEAVVRAFERQIRGQGYATPIDGEVGRVVWRAAWCAPIT